MLDLQRLTVDFFHPGLPQRAGGFDEIPTINWPFARASTFLVTLVLYLGWIAYGCLERRKEDLGRKSPSRSWLASRAMHYIQIVYNAFQVALCTKIFMRTLRVIIDQKLTFYGNEFRALGDYKLRSIDGSGWESTESLTATLWLFYISKILDFADTVFIVLNRKWRQFSFVHCYHHTGTFIVYWISLLSAYDSDIYLTCLLNSSVHIVMYGYYLMCSVGIQLPQKYKMAITAIQIIQFVVMQVQGFCLIFGTTTFPWRVSVMYGSYVATLIPLFLNFAFQNYASRAKSGRKPEQPEREIKQL